MRSVGVANVCSRSQYCCHLRSNVAWSYVAISGSGHRPLSTARSYPAAPGFTLAPLDQSSVAGLDHAFALHLRHRLGTQTQPLAQHLVRVLAEHGRRCDARGLPIDAHRPARHLERSVHGMDHGLHGSALLERDVLVQLIRVQHRSGRNACVAHQLHGIELGVLAGPHGDDLIHLGFPLDAVGGGQIALVANQILPIDQLQQAVPMVRVRSAGHDVDIVVRPARRARIQPHRRVAHAGHLAAAAFGRLPSQAVSRKVDAHVVQHRVLHGDLQAMALARLAALVQRARDRDRHQHAGAGITERHAGPGRRAVLVSGDAEGAAARLGNHVEGEVVLERAAFAEALDLGVDDARIDRLHDVIGQAQPLDGARGKVLDHHVRLADHVLDELEPLGGLEIDRDRLLVGVEGVEIVGIGVGLAGAKTPAGVAHFRVLDLHDIGTQPAECLGTGRTCLELGEIDDLHALQEGEVADAGGHRTSFLTISRSVRARHSASTPSMSNVTRPRASSGSLTWVVRGAYAHPKSHFTGRRSQMSAHHTPEEIRKGLTHPVIDGDGHWVEYPPVFAERIRKVTGDLGANGFLQSQRRGTDSLSMTPEQRAERGVAMEGFWGRQATNTRDRATAMMPRMLYDRADELGSDFGIVYPTAGLGIPRIADDATRRAVIRGFNVVTHEYFKDLGDKLTPAAVIPVHTPDEAIEELEFVTRQLGAKVCTFGSGVRPPIPHAKGTPADLARYAQSFDPLGLDSEHDYDPLWQKRRELGIAPTFHTGGRAHCGRDNPTHLPLTPHC